MRNQDSGEFSQGYEKSTVRYAGAVGHTTSLSDRLLLIVAILLLSGIWLVAPHENPEDGSVFTEVSLGLMYLAAFVGILVERRTAMPLLRSSQPIALMVVLAMLSTVWSDDTWVTLHRSLNTCGATMLSLYFVCRLGLRAFAETFAIAMIISAALSVMLIIFIPELGLMQHQEIGAWRGFWSHKNELGAAMVLGMSTILCFADGSRVSRRGVWTAGFLLLLLLLVGSRSASSAVVALIFALMFPILFWSRAVRSPRPAFIVILVAFGVISAAAITGFGVDDAFGLFGKDATLTGRTELWQDVVDAIAERPVLGYGFQAFFTAHEIAGWAPDHAHNGFFQAALDFGLVGLAVVVTALVTGLSRTAAFFWQSRDRMSAWPLLVMLYTLLSNLTEDSLDQADVRWLLFVASFLFATDAYRRRAGSKSQVLAESESRKLHGGRRPRGSQVARTEV